MATVELELHDGVATVTLNRPEALNAVDPPMRLELYALWERIHADPAIRVAVITGAGPKSFCTGSDLKKAPPTVATPAQQIFGDVPGSGSLIANLTTDKPLIAAVNGFAIGGGMELALACDIRICSDNARFALSEVRVGSMPGAGGTVRLPRYVARSDAMLMLLTGDQFSAADALRMGLVSRVCPPPDLLREAQAIARRIASNAPLSVRAVKRMVTQGQDMPIDTAIDAERCAFGLLYQSEDRLEGRRAFAEKRPPRFQGR